MLNMPHPNRPSYPELLDLAFVPRLADTTSDVENDPSASEDGSNAVENHDSDADSQPDPDAPWVQKVGHAWGPRAHRFFGHIVHNLAVVDHLRLGSVRLLGLERLPPGLVSKSLAPWAGGSAVEAAALGVVQDGVRVRAREGSEGHLGLWRWPADTTACLARLSAYQNEW